MITQTDLQAANFAALLIGEPESVWNRREWFLAKVEQFKLTARSWRQSELACHHANDLNGECFAQRNAIQNDQWAEWAEKMASKV